MRDKEINGPPNVNNFVITVPSNLWEQQRPNPEPYPCSHKFINSSGDNVTILKFDKSMLLLYVHQFRKIFLKKHIAMYAINYSFYLWRIKRIFEIHSKRRAWRHGGCHLRLARAGHDLRRKDNRQTHTYMQKIHAGILDTWSSIFLKSNPIVDLNLCCNPRIHSRTHFCLETRAGSRSLWYYIAHAKALATHLATIIAKIPFRSLQPYFTWPSTGRPGAAA